MARHPVTLFRPDRSMRAALSVLVLVCAVSAPPLEARQRDAGLTIDEYVAALDATRDRVAALTADRRADVDNIVAALPPTWVVSASNRTYRLSTSWLLIELNRWREHPDTAVLADISGPWRLAGAMRWPWQLDCAIAPRAGGTRADSRAQGISRGPRADVVRGDARRRDGDARPMAPRRGEIVGHSDDHAAGGLRTGGAGDCRRGLRPVPGPPDRRGGAASGDSPARGPGQPIVAAVARRRRCGGGAWSMAGRDSLAYWCGITFLEARATGAPTRRGRRANTCGSPVEAASGHATALTRLLERVWYGRAPATRQLRYVLAPLGSSDARRTESRRSRLLVPAGILIASCSPCVRLASGTGDRGEGHVVLLVLGGTRAIYLLQAPGTASSDGSPRGPTSRSRLATLILAEPTTAADAARAAVDASRSGRAGHRHWAGGARFLAAETRPDRRPDTRGSPCRRSPRPSPAPRRRSRSRPAPVGTRPLPSRSTAICAGRRGRDESAAAAPSGGRRPRRSPTPDCAPATSNSCSPRSARAESGACSGTNVPRAPPTLARRSRPPVKWSDGAGRVAGRAADLLAAQRPDHSAGGEPAVAARVRADAGSLYQRAGAASVAVEVAYRRTRIGSRAGLA